MTPNSEILSEFELFSGGIQGIENWITPETDNRVFERLAEINKNPLSREQLNQLLTIRHVANVSDGFFKYYWLSAPEHIYDVKKIPKYDQKWIGKLNIQSRDQIYWGLYRLYIDCLLFFGNIRNGYRFFRTKSFEELTDFFQSKMYNTDLLQLRGKPLFLEDIAKEKRYLISEMACKAFGTTPTPESNLKNALIKGWEFIGKKKDVSIKEIIEAFTKKNQIDYEEQIIYSATDILDQKISTKNQLLEEYQKIADDFINSREIASRNTHAYLSLVDDLDVYVATSMRSKDDFINMAEICEKIFLNDKLKPFHLRYFDPTFSAAEGHENKGLIECLMVKCAKLLLYVAGSKESYGKDAEAAMALSLGKPVIFLCKDSEKANFYRNVHPLSKLIQFETGVAVGAMITESVDDVIELINRLFQNKMEYKIEQYKPGYLRLTEKLTNSVVRLQSNDLLIHETFWNYYHNK